MLLPYASLRCYTAARRTNKSSVFRVFLRFADWLSILPPQPAIPVFEEYSFLDKEERPAKCGLFSLPIVSRDTKSNFSHGEFRKVSGQTQHNSRFLETRHRDRRINALRGRVAGVSGLLRPRCADVAAYVQSRLRVLAKRCKTSCSGHLVPQLFDVPPLGGNADVPFKCDHPTQR